MKATDAIKELCGILAKANPTGINQYTGKGAGSGYAAHKASSIAEQATDVARNTGSALHHGTAMVAHQDAAKSHRAAAESVKSSSNTNSRHIAAAQHERTARYHDFEAAQHEPHIGGK